MAKDNISKIGGGILFFLLPFLLYAGGSKGIVFCGSATDNLYLLGIKEGGTILSVNPFLQYEKFLDFKYDGKAMVINFDNSNLLFENYIELQKKIYLPGVGNKNIIYSNVSSVFPMSYEIFRVADVTIGDSLNMYLGSKYLISPGISVKGKYFQSDSITDYLEPMAKIAASIPLPYFFLVPIITAGSRMYGQEKLLFYRINPNFSFPLMLDFSFTLSMLYYKSDTPAPEYQIPEAYLNDIFFEEETIERDVEFGAVINKVFLEQRLQSSLNVYLFNKTFFQVADSTREDEGVQASLKIIKNLNRKLFFSLRIEFIFNQSNIEEFDYTKNSADLSVGFVF